MNDITGFPKQIGPLVDQLHLARTHEAHILKQTSLRSWLVTIVVVLSLVINTIVFVNMDGKSSEASKSRAQQLQVAECTLQVIKQHYHIFVKHPIPNCTTKVG
jgi:hypothetical protein